MVDLGELQRERLRVAWEEHVADEESVVRTLVAFANDRANLGGGYVVCGAAEEQDEHGFQRVRWVGLSASRLKTLEGKVLAMCRDRVDPPLAPRVEEIPASPSARVLVFVMPQSGKAHQLRPKDGPPAHFIRVGRETREARNGLLLELLTLRGAVEPWDRQPNPHATEADLDLLVLRDTLQRLGIYSPSRGIEPYLSDTVPIHALVPPLLVREPLTNVMRPRNYAVLLFGREVQRFIPGAVTNVSVYPGTDRSEPHAERHELVGTLLEQARQVLELLDVQSSTLFEKTDAAHPNAQKYPRRAVHEAAVNALVHRRYDLVDPTRITVFADRIELDSPGALPVGVDPVAWREGRAGAKWRNQALAWFLNRLQLAQAEGQGIPTIVATMRDEGNPPPTFDANEGRVLCVLPAHPRHARTRALQAVEDALALGRFDDAAAEVARLLDEDPLDTRTLLLFAEVQRTLRDAGPVRALLARHDGALSTLPARVLVALADALPRGDWPIKERLWEEAARRTSAIGDVRRIAEGLKRFVDPSRALEFLDQQATRHPEWRDDPWLLQIRGDSLIGLAKQCTDTGYDRSLPPATRQRAWRACARYLDDAERLLRSAIAADEPEVARVAALNLEFLERLRVKVAGKAR